MRLLRKETFEFKQNAHKRNIPVQGLLIDYVFFEETEYKGRSSHRKVALEFIKVMNEKRNVPGIYYTELLYFDCLPRYGNQLQYRYAVNPALMYGKLSTIEELISIDNKSAGGYQSMYTFLFLHPPYSYGGKKNHFIQLNDWLFPDKKMLTVYEWNSEWSNYFSFGRELYGGFLWTIYDKAQHKFTVIGISIAD